MLYLSVTGFFTSSLTASSAAVLVSWYPIDYPGLCSDPRATTATRELIYRSRIICSFEVFAWLGDLALPANVAKYSVIG